MYQLLIVEDSPTQAELLRSTVEDAGFSVLVARDAETALELLEKHTIDLVISDIVMPGVSGVELAKSVQKSRPGTKVLLMSGYFPDGLEFREGWKFLHKPFSPGVLTEAIESLLRAA